MCSKKPKCVLTKLRKWRLFCIDFWWNNLEKFLKEKIIRTNVSNHSKVFFIASPIWWRFERCCSGFQLWRDFTLKEIHQLPVEILLKANLFYPQTSKIIHFVLKIMMNLSIIPIQKQLKKGMSSIPILLLKKALIVTYILAALKLV